MKTAMCFEDLDAWKRARELVNGVYSLCRDSGVAKDFGLRDQIQRASVSVMSNLAEGFERTEGSILQHRKGLLRGGAVVAVCD